MKINKKVISLSLIFIFIFSGFMVTKVNAAKYEWKLAHEELEAGFMHNTALKFKELLAEKSDGAINLSVYASGQLGTSKDMVELVQQRAIQFNFADAGHIGTLIPEEQVFLLHHVFPQDIEVVWDVLNNGEAVEMLKSKFREKRLEPLARFTEGWQVWTTNKPIKEPSDFKGFKMRTMTSKLILEAYKAYGANPTPTPFSEVYSNLQLNMVDGQVNPIPVIEEMNFYEVQDYLINGYTNPFVLTLITNANFYNSLPEDIQKIVKEAAVETIEFSRKWEKDTREKRLEIMMEEKPSLEYIKLSQEEKEAFEKLAKPVRDIFVDKIAGEEGAKILEVLKEDIKNFSK